MIRKPDQLIDDLMGENESLKKTIDKLERQIEDMKNCGNCRLRGSCGNCCSDGDFYWEAADSSWIYK